MTFQPPPPPPGSTPPPPPPAGPAGFDPKSINTLDWAILGAGVLGFIFSLFGYYKASAFGYSDTEGAFGDGFFGWFAALLALAAAAVLAVHLFRPQVSLPVPARVLALILFVIAFICQFITLFINPTDVPDKYFSLGFGFWISFILVIIGTVLSVVRAQQTNTALPGPLKNIPKIGS